MNTTAPFFSWTCLFPDDACYHFAQHTAWAREGIQPRGGGDQGPAVFVTAGQPAAALPDLGRFAGLVAVNCGGLTSVRLRGAGFPYVRRFAVLPGLHKPRWFIPLDTPALSAAGFCLCAPFKAAAQVRHHGARAAARIGFPLWYRDELCIAQREVPPLERAMQALFPETPLRMAISSGTPPPAINRKISLAMLSAAGRVLAFAKLPGPCAVSGQNVRNEAEVLSQLARRPGTSAPRLLFAGNVGARYVAVSTPLPGRHPRPEPGDAHRRFLDGLRADSLEPAAGTAFARSLSRRAGLLASRPDLLAALRYLLAELGQFRFPATTVHGDFVPWNLREHSGAISAFDWEYGQIDGLPLIDETHHLLAVGYLLKKWTPAHACGRLMDAASAGPLGLPPRAVRALQLAYLLDYLLRLFAEGHDDDYPRVAWCRDIVARMAPATVKGAAA